MERFISAFKEASLRFSRDGCAFLAQAVAFNALFALFPLVVLLISAATFLIPDAQNRALGFFHTLAPTLNDFIARNLQTYIFGRGVSSIIALIFLLWSGKNLFMGLAYALDRALSVPKGRPLVHNLALSFVMLPVTGVMLVVAIALPVLLSVILRISHIPDPARLTHLGAYLISILLVFIVTLVLYRWLPNREVSWRFARPGAVIVAILWPIVQYAFAQYVTHVNFTHIYGALSAPLVLLLWFYCIGSIFFFGAEYCAAWAAHAGIDHVPTLVDELVT
jgi:membrane protein